MSLQISRPVGAQHLPVPGPSLTNTEVFRASRATRPRWFLSSYLTPLAFQTKALMCPTSAGNGVIRGDAGPAQVLAALRCARLGPLRRLLPQARVNRHRLAQAGQVGSWCQIIPIKAIGLSSLTHSLREAQQR